MKMTLKLFTFGLLSCVGIGAFAGASVPPMEYKTIGNPEAPQGGTFQRSMTEPASLNPIIVPLLLGCLEASILNDESDNGAYRAAKHRASDHAEYRPPGRNDADFSCHRKPLGTPVWDDPNGGAVAFTRAGLCAGAARRWRLGTDWETYGVTVP